MSSDCGSNGQPSSSAFAASSLWTWHDFARLTAWALRRGRGTPLLLGIARDAPGITPAAKIRFDCCVQVPAAFEADGEIGCQRTPGGDHAITEYVGSWNLRPAYQSILERLGKMPTLDIIGLPALEIYRTTQVGALDGLARVAIAIPVSRLGAR